MYAVHFLTLLVINLIYSNLITFNNFRLWFLSDSATGIIDMISHYKLFSVSWNLRQVIYNMT